MKHKFTFLFLFATASSFSQNCNCTVSQVQNNTVVPCNLTIGTVVTVSTPTALINAINQVNSNGGNMTILIANGTYQIASTSWYPYITASNVVFRSVSGNRDSVIIRGGGMQSVSGTEDGFSIAGNNVTIADMTIKEVGNHGIQVSGHNLYVHNVRFQNTYQQMLKGATGAASIDSAVVQCSLFEYPSGIGPYYYIGGLDIHKGNGWIVSDNVFRNIISPSGSAAEHAVHFWDNCANNIVERNLIINCDRGIGFGLGSSPNTGGIIRNNMIYNNGSGQFDDVGIGLETSPNTRVYNNTVYISYFNAIEYRFAATSGVDIVNNLTNKLIAARDGGTATLATNVTNAQAGWFVNTTSCDLHLASSQATVVNQGTSLTAYVAEDIDKTIRPQASGYDIGADEFVIASGVGFYPDNFSIEIFPNPSAGMFTVQWLMAKGNTSTISRQPFTIVVCNVFGVKVYLSDLVFEVNEIDLSDQPRGIYFVKVLDGNGGFSVRKIMKV